MIQPRFDVLGIGNAIYDVLASVDDDFLVRERLVKGEMRLVDAARSRQIYDRIGPAVRISGGSAGNTVSGVAALGGRAAFIGKVADDAVGDAYGHDMRGFGVHFDVAPLSGGAPSATSIILITPDGERTMNTYLGACQHLGPADVDADLVAASAITYLEGYLWDPPAAKDAFRKAAHIAHAAGRRVALTLSDAFCVDRWRSDFTDLLRSGTVNLLFANEHELKALYGSPSVTDAVTALQADCPLAAITLGAEGSLVVTRTDVIAVPAAPVDQVVDLTGAGDLYAGGFLFGLSHGRPLAECATLGSLAAAEVIRHVGARPQTSLADLARQSRVAA